MSEVNFQRTLLSIKEGGKPGFTGESLSRDQAAQIKQAIEDQKQRWDDYWKFCVETRLEL